MATPLLSIKIKNFDKVFKLIKENNLRFFQRIRSLWAKEGKLIIRRLVAKFYSGQSSESLGKRTGTASRSFRVETKRSTGTINVVQKIFIDPSSAASAYIMTHDKSRNFNGVIRAKNNPRLIFKGDRDGKIVKVKKVFIPVRTNIIPFLDKEVRGSVMQTVNIALKSFG